MLSFCASTKGMVINMATRCPGCNRRLTLLDWKQTCPECGTNLIFHGFEERFYEDAKYSELGLAKVRVWWAKVLSCFFGGKLQVMRLIFILLPPAALLVPFCGFHIELPLYSSDISINLIGAISAFTDGTVNAVLSLGGAPVTGIAVSALASVFIAFVGALLCGVLIILFQILCFLGAKAISCVICAFSVLGAGFCVYSIFASKALADAVQGFDTLFSFTGGLGAYVAIAAFAAVFVPNLLLAVKGVNIKYKEGDLYRVDIAKKLKRGEIKLEDLPQPIFETEEERIERERAIEDTVNGVSPENDVQGEAETV